MESIEKERQYSKELKRKLLKTEETLKQTLEANKKLKIEMFEKEKNLQNQIDQFSQEIAR